MTSFRIPIQTVLKIIGKADELYSTFFISVTFQNTSDCLTLSLQCEFYDASENKIYANNNRVVIN